MGKFKELELELETLKNQYTEQKEKIQSRAFELMALKLEKNAELKQAIEKLESSRELTSTEDEYFSRWIRFNASEFIDTDSQLEKDALENYLAENFCAYVDFKNDALMTSEGPSIVINDDGDVYDQDSGKFIVNKKDYETDSERNQLIESWMEKQGYFPSVISCDRYGSAFYVNTKES